MRVSWTRLTLFGLAGAFGLGVLAWYDPPPRKSRVDRHTGQELDRFGRPISLRHVRDPAQVLAEARVTADPTLAFEVLRDARHELPSPTQFRSLEHRLTAETLTPSEVADEVELWDPVSAGEIRDAIAMADLALERHVDEPLTPPELHALLVERERDAEIAASTERLFQPLAGQRDQTLDSVIAARDEPRRPDFIAALIRSMRDASPEDVIATRLLAADAFRSAGRRRARFRWLLRAFETAPTSPDVVYALADAYVEHSELLPAAAVLDTAARAGLDTVELWSRRLQIATWSDRADHRVGALERLTAHEPTDARREELLALHTYLGQPLRALPHALALAESTNRPEAYERAATMSFAAGLLDDGFNLIDRAAAAADDPLPWHRMWLDLKEQDLQVDAAITRLQTLYEDFPEFEPRLESLLRRSHRRRELAELLDARLARDPSPALRKEVVRLWAELGEHDRVKAIGAVELQRLKDPFAYFDRLPLYQTMGLAGLLEVGERMVASPLLHDEHFELAANAFEAATRRDARFAPLLAALVQRFAHLESAPRYVLAEIDANGSPSEAAHAAESAWLASPESRPFLVAWVDRATWASLPEMELRARHELLRREPEDLENRRRVADLLESMHRLRDALAEWRTIAKVDGPGSESETRLLMLLESLEMEEEALAILADREARGELSIDERLALADRFFGAERLDRALELFESALAQEPDNRAALLRVGQIRSWSNDPSGAVPFFERLIELDGNGDGEPPFLLGDAYWATQREDEGAEMLQRALPLLRDPELLTRDRETMLAKSLSRLGQTEEAGAIYQRLIAAEPKNQGLMLDYADGMVAGRRFDLARDAVELARPLGAEARRLLRLDGQLRIEEKLYVPAIVALTRGLELYGPDAGTYADLGRAHEALGNWGSAMVAFGYSLELQPDNGDVAYVHRIVSDRLSDRTVEVHVRSSSVDEDSTLDVVAEATMLLDEDHTRGSVRLSQASFSGRARAVDDGRTDVDADVTTLSLSACRRLDDEWEVGGGLDFYTGRDDAEPAGLWLAAGRRSRDPFREMAARLHVNEPLRDPAAAVGLGGSSSGIDLTYFRETDDQQWWMSGAVGYRTLSLEHPRKGEIRDGQARLELALGRWINSGGPDIHQRLDVRHCPSTFEGTTVIGESPADTGPRLAAWVAYSGVRLLDDKELARAVPLGEEFDYLTATGRLVDAVAMGLRYEVQGTLGTDLAGSGSVVNVSVTGAWRPDADTEVRLGLSFGRALGREGADNAIGLELGVVLRW